MTEREMLELAAKAAGIVGEWVAEYGADYYYTGNTEGILYKHAGGGDSVWNPLEYDGDAFRLAVDLRFRVEDSDNEMAVCCSKYGDDHAMGTYAAYADHTDRRAAYRRAITQAAAEIGRTMP